MLKHHNYKNSNLLQILESFSHYQQVNFAFYCAKDVESLANDQRVVDCNNTVERWLKGDKSVDLELARNNARNAWDTYSDATAYSPVYAASAAYYAVSSAAHADYASTAAVNAACAKSYNLYPNNKKQMTIAYKQFRQEYVQLAQNWLSYLANSQLS